MTMKDNLNLIEVGDKVILSSRHGYFLAVVSKVTPTQIQVGNTKYRKNDGSEINRDKWNFTTIYAPLALTYKGSNETNLDLYTKQRQQEKLEKQDLINQIKALDFEKLSVNKLKEMLQSAKD